MPTFDGTPKTKTRVPLDKDAFSPAMGALTGSGFKEDAMIHGTRNELVEGDITLLYSSNVERTVTGNRTLTTVGSTTETQIGSVTVTRVSNYMYTVVGNEVGMNVGPTMHTRIGAVTILNPTATMVNSGDLYENKIFKGQNYALRNTNIGVDVGLRVENCSAGLHATSIFQFQTRMTVTELAVKAAQLATGLNFAEMRAAQQKLLAQQCTLAITKMLVAPRVQVPPESIPGAE